MDDRVEVTTPYAAATAAWPSPTIAATLDGGADGWMAAAPAPDGGVATVLPSRRNTSGFHWSNKEHEAFLRGMEVYGRQWAKIAEHFVPSR